MPMVIVATLLAIAAAAEGQPPGVSSPSIAVTVQPEGHTGLAFKVTLQSPRTLSVPLDSLPWGAYPNLQIVAARGDATGTLLSQATKFREPVESPLATLVVDKPIRGTVQLADYVSDLQMALRQFDVVVFWSYCLEGPPNVRSNRTGGWLVLSKSH